MTRAKSVFLALVAVLLSPTAANADVITTYALPFLGSGPSTDNGFLTAFPSSFVDAFSMDNAHSYLQLDISGLAGQTITSAILSFNIGGGLVEQVTVTSFESFGMLGLFFNAPNVLDSELFTVDGSSALTHNSLDVTSLLAQRVGAGADYFALHFAPVNDIYYLFLQPTGEENLRLIVTTVPEPGTLALLGLGFAGMGFTRRRKKA